jgi:hypothetical protein
LQIFSLKLAELYWNAGSLQLYGYVAVRDHMDPLLNYVVNISRDDPITVEQVQFHTYFLQLFQGTILAPQIFYLTPSNIKPGIRPLKIFHTV